MNSRVLMISASPLVNGACRQSSFISFVGSLGRHEDFWRVFSPAWLLALFLLGHCSSRLFPSGYESLWLRRAELNLPSQGSPFYSLTLLVERLPGCFSLLLPISVVSGMASWEVRLPCLSTLSGCRQAPWLITNWFFGSDLSPSWRS